MIPILYEHSETAFTTNGVCRLIDCLSCTVTEERNGVYECEFTYPVTGRNYGEIAVGRIIYATHDDTKTPQPFDIYKRTASISGVTTFFARHIAYRLANVILRPFTAQSCALTMAALVDNSLNANPFTFWTDKQVNSVFRLLTPRSVWETLRGSEGSILDVYGKGTYEFDKFTVKLHLNRGQRTDIQIRYGKNLTDFEHTMDSGGLHNTAVPFWKSAEGDTVVTVPGWFVSAPGTVEPEYTSLAASDAVVLTDPSGVPVLVEVLNGTGVVPEIMDLSESFEEEPTPEQLRSTALARLSRNKPWNPDENYRIDFTALWQTPEYESVSPLQRVGLCDTVDLCFPELGIAAEDAQVIKTVYNTLLERYDSMELGQPARTLGELIKQDVMQDVERTILSQVPSTSAMEQAIAAATQLLTGGTGGHVVIASDADGKPNEILVMDTEDRATAVNVLRINVNGIGFSNRGYNGPFRTAWTLNGGFVADFITTGVLDGTLLQANSVTADKIDVTDLFSQNITCTNKFQIDTDDFKMYSGQDTSAGTGFEVLSIDTGGAAGSLIANPGGVTISAGKNGNGGAVRIIRNYVNDFYDVEIASSGSSGRVIIYADSSVDFHDGDVNISEDLTVYGSIKEGNTALTDKYNKKLSVHAKSITVSNVAAGSTASGTVALNWPHQVPVGIVGYTTGTETGNSLFNVSRLYLDGSNIKYLVRNIHSTTSYSCTLTVYVLYEHE